MNSLAAQVFAAVDLGSNSFHMIIARYQDGKLQVVDREKEMVRLSAGLTASGKISRKVSSRALDCVRQFGKLTQDMHASVVRAVGTDALRRAKNSDTFLEAAEELLGHPIEVISGQEEARLVFLGATHTMPPFDGWRLVTDIGGGSTELILGENFSPHVMESIKLGCVGLTEQFFAGGKITDKRWKQAKRAAAAELKPLRSSLKGWHEAIGTSGTIRCINKVLLEKGWSKKNISTKGLEKLEKYMIDKGHVEKLQLSGLSDRRAPVFAGGVTMLQAIFSVLEVDSMQPARGALREGLIYDMLAEAHPDFSEPVAGSL